MTSGLHGNPHSRDWHNSPYGEHRATATATRALAFERRLASLIELRGQLSSRDAGLDARIVEMLGSDAPAELQQKPPTTRQGGHHG